MPRFQSSAYSHLPPVRRNGSADVYIEQVRQAAPRTGPQLTSFVGLVASAVQAERGGNLSTSQWTSLTTLLSQANVADSGEKMVDILKRLAEIARDSGAPRTAEATEEVQAWVKTEHGIGTPLYKNPWFYIGIVGAGVVGAGLYFYLRRRAEAPAGPEASAPLPIAESAEEPSGPQEAEEEEPSEEEIAQPAPEEAASQESEA